MTRAGPRSPHLDNGLKPGARAVQPGLVRGSGSPRLLFLQAASRGQHSLTNRTHPRLMVMLCLAGIVPGTTHISSLYPQKCYYFLFADHEMEADGLKGLSKITQQ